MEILEKKSGNKQLHNAVKLLWCALFFSASDIIAGFLIFNNRPSPGFIIAIVLIFAFWSFLTLSISRKKLGALIVYTALTIIGLPFNTLLVVSEFKLSIAAGILALLANVLPFVAICMLFFGNAKEAFKRQYK